MKKSPKVITVTKVLHSENLDRLITMESIDTILSPSKRNAVLHISFSDEEDMNNYIQKRLEGIDGYVVTGKTITSDYDITGVFGGSAETELLVEEKFLRKLGFYEIQK